MEVERVLHMKGGDEETSYAKNSLQQKRLITIAKPIIEEAMVRLYNSKFPTQGSHVAMADLGCSTGINALMAVHGLITIFDRIRHDHGHQDWLPEFQVFLNDLPGNDFDTIFRALPGFLQQLKDELGSRYGRCFVNGVPGSFYGRLFPSHSLHFVNAFSCLHWLSQVPRSKCRSEESVEEAYYQQFQSDFSTFLKCRSEEIVSGGCMVITFVSRKTEYPRHYENHFPYCQTLKKALTQLTNEGLIEEEKMDEFDLPLYAPTMAEVETEVKKEGSFVVSHSTFLEAKDDNKYFEDDESKEGRIIYMVRSARSIHEPFLLGHFGESLSIDEVFRRYEEVVRECIADLRFAADGIVVSLTKN